MKFQKGSIRKSLKFSILDGLCTAMMQGVSENYLLAYGIALGATALQVGYLAAVPPLIGALLQMRSARVTQSIGSRTKLINVMVFFHALAWLPIILLPYVIPNHDFIPWALMIASVFFISFGAFAVPAWQSLMSDYIPVTKRGKYFGWRNRVQGVFTVSVMVLAGLILHHFGKDSLTGFTNIFTFAMVCRFIAWWCVTRMAEPFRHSSHDVYFSFIDFVKQIRTSNFAKFVLFVSMMSFSVFLSAPLLNIFLLNDLKFSYAAYMVVVTVAACSGFIFQAVWGHWADRVGNVKLLKFAGWGIAIMPVFWLVSQNLVFLVIVQIFAGLFWGGFNLLVINFIMEAVSPEKKIRCFSYFNVMNAFAMLLGALAGGYLINHLPPLFGYSFLTLFLLSCVSRSLVMFFLCGKIKEVRAFSL